MILLMSLRFHRLHDSIMPNDGPLALLIGFDMGSPQFTLATKIIAIVGLLPALATDCWCCTSPIVGVNGSVLINGGVDVSAGSALWCSQES
jgi:hypothetical protein